MGFSVSGATVVVLTALLVAFGMWSTAAANGLERVTEAQDAAAERQLDRTNTAIDIASATQTGSTVSVDVENTGTESWYVGELDLVVDGTYETDWTIGGSSDLVRPGETRTIDVTVGGTAGRVTVVAPTGPAAASGVT